jgi:hypothetical protein
MSKLGHIFLHHEFHTFMYVCTVYIYVCQYYCILYSMCVLSHMTVSSIIAFKLIESFSLVNCHVTDSFQGTCSFGKVRIVYITVQFSTVQFVGT